MFPDNICQNIDILVVINVQKNNFGFHSNQKTQGQKHQVNNLYFINQVCQMILRHLHTFLQFRLLFHEPHCIYICLQQKRCVCPLTSVSAGFNCIMPLVRRLSLMIVFPVGQIANPQINNQVNNLLHTCSYKSTALAFQRLSELVI